MTNEIKVGDKVICVDNVGLGTRLTVGRLYEVKGTPFGFIRVEDNRGSILGFHCERFTLAEEPLPPVPDSVLYFNSYASNGNDQHLKVYTNLDMAEGNRVVRLVINPKTGSIRTNVPLGLHLDPDSALQLAHDLTRMALKLKREQEKDQ